MLKMKALMAAWPCQAQSSLTIGAQSAPSGMDPHYHSSNPHNAILRQVFETLADFDTSGHLVPGLRHLGAPSMTLPGHSSYAMT